MTRWSPSDIPDQSGRTALVTGANSGLGLHTSLELARKGARVLMTARTPSKGEQALARVRREVPAAQVELVPLDLASLESVRGTAEQVAGQVVALDVLVDNAGIMAPPYGRTPDGFELQLGTNFLGHFALTGRLLPLLLAADAARVVVLSSSAHRMGRIDFDDLNSERSYSPWRAYGQSKLADLLFARELQRRAGDALLVAAAHPGYAATNLQSGQGNALVEGAMKVMNVLVAQSDAQGAWPSLYAATMPDVQPGDYWGPRWAELRGEPARAGRSRAAQDDATARRLWDVAEELTGVTYELPAPA